MFDPETERFDEVNEELKIIQYRKGILFGTDAFLLAAFMKRMSRDTAVEFGCGSGIISLLLLQKGKIGRIRAYDVQARYADLARRNAELNGCSGRMTVQCLDVRTLGQSEKTDCVFMNPPYMTEGGGKANMTYELTAARREMNGTIDELCRAASGILETSGRFFCVYRPDRADALIYAMKSCGIQPKVMSLVYPDTSSAPSLLLVYGIKDSAESLKMTRPVFIYRDGKAPDGAREYTDDMQYIYDSCSFDRFYR